jgi:chorismate synthase
VAKKLLAREGIRVLGYVKQVGEVIADVPDPAAVTLEQVEATPVRCPVPEVAARMIGLIDSIRLERDSIGGVCELVATGVPPGLGEPVFDKLKADLGKALLSLPAVLGFEYGAGFAVATARGSANNDVFVPASESHESPVAPDAADCNAAVWEPARSCPPFPSGRGGVGIRTESNRHGGMLGGISSGMPIVCRCAVKPTSSIPQVQRTVTRSGEPTEILVKGRHDPCLLPRFVPMGEAMVALVLIDHLLRNRVSRS